MEYEKSQTTRKGIGSSFAFIDKKDPILKQYITSFCPDNGKLFYNGRQAIKYIIEAIKIEKDSINTIWLPEYYCKHVTGWLKSSYKNIKSYDVNPIDFSKTIIANDFAHDRDVVLVQNFWGASQCQIDCGTKKITIIEDHSHGWLTNSCKQSKADYCLVSLRKSLPIPSGAIVWRPDGKAINKNVKLTSDISFDYVWDTVFKAMTLKNSYESRGLTNEDKKNEFLSLIHHAEQRMNSNYSLIQLDKKHETYIKDYMGIDYLKFKTKNIQKFKTQIKPSNYFTVLPLDLQLFGIILHVKNEQHYKQLYLFLISNNIYPAHLWPDNKTSYGYFINIHTDYRYNETDMIYVAKTLNSFETVTNLA